MANTVKYAWQPNGANNSGFSFLCGHCGAHTGATLSWLASTHIFAGATHVGEAGHSAIHVCSACTKPSFFDAKNKSVIPGQRVGVDLRNLPEPVAALWKEARDCMGAAAYTAGAMLARKLLMNLAVHEGAAENLRFVEYVSYLVANGYVPPKGRSWVNKIKDKGNEANHEIRQVAEDEAREVVMLTELLLRFNYEMADPADAS